MNPSLFGIYIHWPFCASKCPYCDFNSHVSASIDLDLWESSLLMDLESTLQATAHKKVTSIFFGGGTPSTMPPRIAEALIQKIHDLWDVASDVEITLEANPTSVESQKFDALAKAGINRVSLGIQSLNDYNLSFLGRTHSAHEAQTAIAIAQTVFKRHSFDFIYTLPHQTLDAWERELETILSLGTPHLSLYQLTIEEGTPFYLRHARGDFAMPSTDTSALFFEKTRAKAYASGFTAYEVSNFARTPQEVCRHNTCYWQADDYVGIGPGAHGRYYIKGQRIFERRHRAPQKWLDDIKSKGNGMHVHKPMPQTEQVEEILMMGLRLHQGISLSDFQNKTGFGLTELVPPKAIDNLANEGLLIQTNDRLKTTPQGLQKLDGVLSYIFNYNQPKIA